MTVEEYRKMKKKKNKYGNKICVFDGKKFRSIGEKNRYIELKFQEAHGWIACLETQVEYGLVSCKYIADFRYYRDGKMVVEDFKGGSPRTAMYKLKKKMMKSIHKIIILET